MIRRGRQRRWAVAKMIGFSLWMAIVSLVLLWQQASYNGVMALIGEWQFNAIGRQYPTFNYVLLVFVLCLPGYLLFLRPRRHVTLDSLPAATFRSARTLLRAILATALGLAAAALVIVVAMLFLPPTAGAMQQIDLTRPITSLPAQGPTTLTGAVLYERTAGFDEDLLLARRSFRFAPVVGARDDAGEVQFFVQLAPVTDRAAPVVSNVTGILKRNGLPGELVRLFRYAGFHFAEPHYVLFTEPSAMRWPYIAAMVQLLIGALFTLAIALLQQRRVRRIDHIVHSPNHSKTTES